MADEPQQSEPAADENWFREPTAREHRIAAALFIGFGIFFVLLFFVLAGWWFRWVILWLAIYSCLHGVRHALGARQRRETEEITIGGTPRWVGWMSYALLFLGVGGLIAFLLARFTNSLMLAIGLVVFMIAYMLAMGWWASGTHRRR